MKELIEKISSYNLFNYLLPGVVFTVLAQPFTGYSFVQPDLLLAFFVYYFIGMVISRVGSLIVEPILKSRRFIVFAPYSDFVRRSRSDPKLEVLSEANNTYRTFLGLFVSLIALRIATVILSLPKVPQQLGSLALVVCLITLFAFSYRKQSNYIKQRVETG